MSRLTLLLMIILADDLRKGGRKLEIDEIEKMRREAGRQETEERVGEEE